MESIPPAREQAVVRWRVGVHAPTGQGWVVGWSSVSNRFYRVMRSTDLSAGFPDTIAAGLRATPPVNVHTDSVPITPSVYYGINLDSP